MKVFDVECSAWTVYAKNENMLPRKGASKHQVKVYLFVFILQNFKEAGICLCW